MPLATAHNLGAEFTSAYSPSVGASPIAAYFSIPFNGTLKSIRAILGGALTTADCTMTVTNVTTGVAIGTFTVTQSGSAAGTAVTFRPAGYNVSLVTQEDVISIVPSGASGASIPCHFTIGTRTF